jgi:hypothetical protein
VQCWVRSEESSSSSSSSSHMGVMPATKFCALCTQLAPTSIRAALLPLCSLAKLVGAAAGASRGATQSFGAMIAGPAERSGCATLTQVHHAGNVHGGVIASAVREGHGAQQEHGEDGALHGCLELEAMPQGWMQCRQTGAEA